MVDFSIKDLSFTYPNQNKKALDDINLEINSGEFIAVCGKSGSGKSTLLRMLKPCLTPTGKLTGEILYFGKQKECIADKDLTQNIGYLLQNTEYQTVTHTVRSELAFGLENLGLESSIIRLRIAEICAYFSLEDIIDKKISSLSGGQKQLVCLASILAMHPKAVIFDEPTSQLDPVAAQSLLTTAKKLACENSITVIISEHRLENVIEYADRILVLNDGKTQYFGKPDNIPKELFQSNDFIAHAMPCAMRIFSSLNINASLPISVSQGRCALNNLFPNGAAFSDNETVQKKSFEEYCIEAENIWFSYGEKKYVLNNFNIKIPKGSFYGILGSNGAGKTTAISLLAGLLPLKTGKIKIHGRDIKKYSEHELYNNNIAFMPQKCESLFCSDSVKEDLEKILNTKKLSKEIRDKKIREVCDITQISHLLDKHPYDISGGEMQRSALAMILLTNPKIIIADEPTKGMDALFKKQFASIIENLCNNGITFIAVSHDTEFCAEHCDYCSMIFDGMCVLQTDTHSFFTNNFYYTTSANKISRDIFNNTITDKEVISLCKKNLLS